MVEKKSHSIFDQNQNASLEGGGGIGVSQSIQNQKITE